MSIELDPREVLAHLNSLGYRNISAYVLKEFIKNLRKLIAYDTQHSARLPKDDTDSKLSYLKKSDFQDRFEYLYKTTTEATKARNNARLKRTDKENDDPYDFYKLDRIRVDEVMQYPRKCKQGSQQKEINQNAKAQNICKNELNQPSRTSSAPYFIRNTPTDLYQNYQREWSRFKHLLPGENPRVNERQIVRKRMETIQKPQPKAKVFVLMNDDNTKVIRRE
ncbi:hypothetical protein Bhyg_03016 [Pseudolycoriella hygida]|uniref:Uncharacterized protein n=1 Tax=Pseudolycoriella hygida TaxID=35572 RepID=A0A9Q0NCI5_9DIPT|nr:hypothetical protein Bhyg_03016 [Pseudolycoriella hygida]